jgi:Domain of Unknown Function (DUF928)
MVLVMVMPPRSFRWTAIALALALTNTTLSILPSVARYRPPHILQRPEGRQGAATRTICAKEHFAFEPVVPMSNYGQTIEAYPTFYWYLDDHSYSWAMFELYASRNQKFERESEPIYQTIFRIIRNTKLTSFTLPSTVGIPPLKKGRNYLWKVTLICTLENQEVDGAQRSVESWITRVDSKLAKAQRRYEIYGEEGLWYDAIHDLDMQRWKHPQLESLKTDWQELMQETTLRSIYPATQP